MDMLLLINKKFSLSLNFTWYQRSRLFFGFLYAFIVIYALGFLLGKKTRRVPRFLEAASTCLYPTPSAHLLSPRANVYAKKAA